ncbi:MAG: hypothetical protein GX849_08680 [Clostridiaceae bacterium]|jgi:hypothetical protein|nr:hypothetical protein [Clostridiaceae bacterium]
MPNEIVPHNDDMLVQKADAIIPADDETVKVLRLSHHEKGHDYKKMLAAAVQLFSAADIVGKIQKGAEFIVQVGLPPVFVPTSELVKTVSWHPHSFIGLATS